MTIFDHSTLQELIALLGPLLEREAERRPLLESAFGADFPALGSIEWSGKAEPFILRLAEAVADSGDRDALPRLLRAARARLAPALQARVDALESAADRPVTRAPGAAPVHLRVFLASPGDVSAERAIALEVLDQIPYDPAWRDRVTLEAVAWDKPGAGAPMLATMTPQAAIAAGLPKPSDCDIVAVIFWSRMGTPLPAEYRKPDGSPYLSGTEWEYLDALAGNRRNGTPEVLVYRRTEECLLRRKDPQFDEKCHQLDLVEAFFAAFRNPDGSIVRGCNEYAAPEDFRKALDLHLRSVIRRLLDARPAAPAPTAARPAPPPRPLWQGSPFPGLRAFTPEDAPIYFGRGRETDEVVRRLAGGSRFLVVVGASGSGKSSLVAAGLLPRLRDNGIEGAKDWLLPGVTSAGTGERKQWVGLRFTPGELGDNPFVALAAKLAPLLPDETPAPRVAGQLEADPDSLAQRVQSALAGKPAWAEGLLFVDQFEELFTVVAEPHRAPFVAMLSAAARAPRLRVVATLRADFYHFCVERPGLAELLRAASYPLAAPGLAALFEMVTGPAARAGLAFEEGLPARILDDTGTDPGALALLAFALHELYDARADGRLGHAAYDGFGGVRGAIAKRAEDTFRMLPEATQALLPGVFRDLVEVDQRGVATRRRAQRMHGAEAAQLVQAFADARLLVTDRGPAGEPVVEVAHEALLREWPRLVKWIEDRADDLRLLRQAEAAAAEWQRNDADPAHLWPHERLLPLCEALARLGMARDDLAEPARSFVRPETERLLEELERPETADYRRAEIGDRLDRIGDPRPGVGLTPDGVPDIVWCEVPGGKVTLERGAGTVEVAPFRIAKYPVTYRQYKAFLDDPQGYRDKRWWKGLNHREPGEQYRPIANCPAENVSWYDATAFCRWLSKRLGFEVRLPRDAEWQQAATGGNPGNECPWGQWEDGRANSGESRLSRTTAVGMYPPGASAQGALDMAGNVGEWCESRYDPKDKSPEAARVVRGGSWFFNRDYCRCASRGDLGPLNRYDRIGFRLCCAPPIPR